MNEEITIRKFIEIIFKRKIVICIFTIIATLISGIYSFLIMEPLYSSSTILLTNPIEKSNNNNEGIIGVLDTLAIYPVMSIDSYKEQVITNTVLTNAINELSQIYVNEETIQLQDLIRNISVEIISKTNLIRISVLDKDPEKATVIANCVADNFIKYISDNTKKFEKQTTSIIEEMLKDEEKKLEEQAKKMQEYLKNSHNIEQLKLEIQSLHTLIDEYKTYLIDVEKQIDSDSAALSVLLDGEKTFSGIKIDNDIKINVPLDNNNENQNIELSVGSGNELQASLVIIKTTDIETRLIQNMAEKYSLESKINELEDRLIGMQSILTEEEYKYNSIKRNYDLAEETYNAYLDRHKEAILASTANMGESTIIVLSPAITPLNPSGHGKIYYLAIGVFIGLVLGVITSFLIEFWPDNTSDHKKTLKTMDNAK